MRKLLAYVIKSGNVSPCGKFGSRTCNPYSTLWGVYGKYNSMTGDIEELEYDCKKVNIDKDTFADEYRGKKVYKDYIECDNELLRR